MRGERGGERKRVWKSIVREKQIDLESKRERQKETERETERETGRERQKEREGHLSSPV